MYTILVSNDNELITSVKERIMQRSKLVDNLHFLVEPLYKEIDMSEFGVTMEYVLPVSRAYKTERLILADEMYKDRLEYTLPFDTKLTKEPGEIEVQLTFTKVEMDPEGKTKQYVRKTSPTTITIVPISAWSDIVADDALGALDQRLIQAEAILNAVNDMNQTAIDNKADSIHYFADGKYIQLTSNDKPIGAQLKLSEIGDDLDGIDTDYIWEEI